MSAARGFGFTSRVGFVSTWPRAMAWFMIRRKVSSVWLGAARRGAAVFVEPAVDAQAVDTVERQVSEGRQQLGSQGAAHALSRRRLVSIEAGRLPRTGDEGGEGRRLAARAHGPVAGFLRDLDLQAFPAHFGDGLQRRRPQRDAASRDRPPCIDRRNRDAPTGGHGPRDRGRAYPRACIRSRRA